MITKRIRELETAKARLARLEKSLVAKLQQELASLPAAYGFGTVRDFLTAVSAAASSRSRRSPAGGRKAKARPARLAKRRRRAVITDATRAEVKKLVEGGKTGAEIAKALRISLPSVQNIKKSLGLVKGRK